MSKTTMLVEVDVMATGNLPAREIRRLLEDEMRLSTSVVHNRQVVGVGIDEVRVMRVVDDGQITISIPARTDDINPDALARIIKFQRRMRDRGAPEDPLAIAVPLREVLEWVQEWVPKPVRPLWEEAFLKEFAGGSEEPS